MLPSIFLAGSKVQVCAKIPFSSKTRIFVFCYLQFAFRLCKKRAGRSEHFAQVGRSFTLFLIYENFYEAIHYFLSLICKPIELN